jgi:tRNA modification GTPase
MHAREDDTIAAIATAPGEGALAVVRMSGKEALQVGDAVFHGGILLREAAGHTLHVGRVEGIDGTPVDDVVVSVFRGPRSYTGEDVVEISCHGGRRVADSVLEVLLSAGARAADPGEFTRRAFLNGRMDLAQAEAVADLIAAKSARAQRLSLEQLHGRLSSGVAGLRQELLSLCALLELDLDFADEGLEVVSDREATQRARQLARELHRLEDSFSGGRLIRDGVLVVLAGLPNAGKSSLFNALLQEERAIVTHLPGTTRDSLEEQISIDGIAFRLVDTAGLREPDNVAEEQGIMRSRTAVKSADVILYVVDSSIPHTTEEIPEPLMLRSEGQKVVLALNKADLQVSSEVGELERRLSPFCSVRVSAKTGRGLAELKSALLNSVGEIAGNDAVRLSNLRHLAAVQGALVSLERGIEGLQAGLTHEFVASDLRESAQALALITGEVTSGDVLNEIFARFCIGK